MLWIVTVPMLKGSSEVFVYKGVSKFKKVDEPESSGLKAMERSH